MTKTDRVNRREAEVMTARHRLQQAQSKLRSAQRDWLLAEGWVEESRYDGQNAGRVYAYQLPKGKTWHTLRGAMEKQAKRKNRKGGA